MKYYIVKDLVSLNSGFSIKNENNIEEYRFSSPIITITPKTTMTDTDGNAVAKIERKLFQMGANIRRYKIMGVFERNKYLQINGIDNWINV